MPQEHPPANTQQTPPVTIKTVDDGPLQIKGPVQLVDHDGTTYEVGRRMVVLCRCGRSGSKPFCDGTHAKVGFSAGERASAENP